MKTQTPTLPESGQQVCGGGLVLKPILVFSFDQTVLIQTQLNRVATDISR